MKIYTVEVERKGRLWSIRLPEIDRTAVALHLRDVEVIARDLVATVEPDASCTFDVNLDVRLPDPVERHLEVTKRLRAEAVEAKRRAAEATRTAARGLLDAGLSVGDVRVLLGMLHPGPESDHRPPPVQVVE